MNIKEYTKLPKVSGLYQIINLKNNKMYIGSAINLRRRIHKHYYELVTKTHNNKHLLNAFIKYGEECFSVNIFILNVDYKKLLQKEKEMILETDVITSGYNMILDNANHFSKLNTCPKHISNNRKKQSKPVFGFNRFTGELIYTCVSISEAAKQINDQTTNISSCCQKKLNHVKNVIWIYQKDYDPDYKYIFKHNANKGRKFSKEHSEKIRQQTIKRKGKPVFMYDHSLMLIKEYNTVAEAERDNNINKDMLRYKLDKNKLHLGYFWKTNKL